MFGLLRSYMARRAVVVGYCRSETVIGCIVVLRVVVGSLTTAAVRMQRMAAVRTQIAAGRKLTYRPLQHHICCSRMRIVKLSLDQPCSPKVAEPAVVLVRVRR